PPRPWDTRTAVRLLRMNCELVGPPGFEPGTKGRDRALARCVEAHLARGRAPGHGMSGPAHAPGTVQWRWLVGPPGFEPGTKGRDRAFARCVEAHLARGRAPGHGMSGPAPRTRDGSVETVGGPTRIRTWNQRIMSPLL